MPSRVSLTAAACRPWQRANVKMAKCRLDADRWWSTTSRQMKRMVESKSWERAKREREQRKRLISFSASEKFARAKGKFFDVEFSIEKRFSSSGKLFAWKIAFSPRQIWSEFGANGRLFLMEILNLKKFVFRSVGILRSHCNRQKHESNLIKLDREIGNVTHRNRLFACEQMRIDFVIEFDKLGQTLIRKQRLKTEKIDQSRMAHANARENQFEKALLLCTHSGDKFQPSENRLKLLIRKF